MRILYIDTVLEHINTVCSAFNGLQPEVEKGDEWKAEVDRVACNGAHGQRLGFEALTFLQPELLIVGDKDVGELDQWEFVHRVLHSKMAGLRDRPYVVVLTGRGLTRQIRAKCEECGADEVVPKPTEFAMLGKWMERAKAASKVLEPWNLGPIEVDSEHNS